jgi:predicted RNase H-like HicB family nuclease
MQYRVQLQKTEEGYAVWCPGCWFQGKTETEALENMKEAIKTYLDTVNELNKGKRVRVVDVSV